MAILAFSALQTVICRVKMTSKAGVGGRCPVMRRIDPRPLWLGSSSLPYLLLW